MIAWIRTSTLSRMREEAERRAPLETGGVLLGYWSADEQSTLISDASGPGPRATHRRFDFAPDAKFQEAYVAQAYEDSGRVSTYLGDWHSHPGGGDELSPTDVATLWRIARYARARARRPMMAILSGTRGRWSLAVWVLRSRGCFLRPRAEIMRAEVKVC